MQFLDVPSVKLLSHEKTDNPKIWKYTFFNTQTGIKDYFHSLKKVNHIPNLPGYLLLTIDDNQQKNFFYFKHNFVGFQSKEPINFEEPLKKELVESKFKKTITKLTPQQIRKLRDKGCSWKEIREFCNVSEWTIRRWNKKELALPKKKSGRKSKINGKDLTFLEDCVNSHRFHTQQQIAEILSCIAGQKISQPTVCRLYKKYGITKKAPIYNYSEQKSFLKDIKPFTDKVKLLPQSQVIAEDECAFYLNEAPRRGYGWKGERVISWKPGNFVERYTLMLCVRNVEKQSVVSYKLIKHDTKKKKKHKKEIKKGTGAVEFHDFVLDIKSKLPTNEEYYLLLDNAKIHRAIGACIKAGRFPIRELFIKINIEPKYLIAYSPQLNPVELCFNFLRHYVEENQPRTHEELKLIIEQGIEELQKKDMTKYFRHCMNYDFSKNEQGFWIM